MAPTAGAFDAGVATVNITPPAYTAGSDAAFVPACGTTPAQVAELWPGPRDFAFEKPYIDSYKLGRFAPGDPYCDADGTSRYEAPYLAGGSGQNRWPASIDPGNGPEARAIVMTHGKSKVAIVAVDSIGIFDSTMKRIRDEVKRLDPSLTRIFISSTHDESAPDPIGLWGPGTTISGVDDYYMTFMVEQVAHAVVAADAAQTPATLEASIGTMPSNTLSCWSSYPFIDDQSLPVLQARDESGNVIFTLVDVSTHAETLSFSGVPEYTSMISADWPGQMRKALEARWPGSVGIELAGLVGSVETPTVYEPESTQVLRIPEAFHEVAGNPNGCGSVYPLPASGTPVSNAHEFLAAYGKSVANAAASALEGAPVFTPRTLHAQQKSLCIELENNYFAEGFAIGLFADRPAYSNPSCTKQAKRVTGEPYLKSAVGVLTLGPVQLAYSPGEVFPFTEVRGAMDEEHMAFPTNCYEPLTENFFCGEPLPMTQWISADMTRPYRFLVGLGEDMDGYIFPPGNFVGEELESNQEPWMRYEDENKNGGNDRFGYGHADDSESVGPYVGLRVTDALQELLTKDGTPTETAPGLYLDAEGHLSISPFASGSFTGAIGVEVLLPDTTQPEKLLIGQQAEGWATFDARSDPGTAGTALPYSVRTAGVMLTDGEPLLIDVYEGAKALGLEPG